MLSKEYAAIRRALIDPDKAIDGEAPFGNPTSAPTDFGRRYGGQAAARACGSAA